MQYLSLAVFIFLCAGIILLLTPKGIYYGQEDTKSGSGD